MSRKLASDAGHRGLAVNFGAEWKKDESLELLEQRYRRPRRADIESLACRSRARSEFGAEASIERKMERKSRRREQPSIKVLVCIQNQLLSVRRIRQGDAYTQPRSSLSSRCRGGSYCLRFQLQRTRSRQQKAVYFDSDYTRALLFARFIVLIRLTAALQTASETITLPHRFVRRHTRLVFVVFSCPAVSVVFPSHRNGVSVILVNNYTTLSPPARRSSDSSPTWLFSAISVSETHARAFQSLVNRVRRELQVEERRRRKARGKKQDRSQRKATLDTLA